MVHGVTIVGASDQYVMSSVCRVLGLSVMGLLCLRFFHVSVLSLLGFVKVCHTFSCLVLDLSCLKFVVSLVCCVFGMLCLWFVMSWVCHVLFLSCFGFVVSRFVVS